MNLEYLVQGLVPKKRIGFLAGESQIGKSAVIANLAASLAGGDAFFGRFIPANVGVLVVSAEKFDEFRIQLAAAAEEVTGSRNLPIRTMQSCPDLFNDLFLTQFIMFIREQWAVPQARGAPALGLIVLETMSQIFNMSDENSAPEARKVLLALRKICKRPMNDF